MPARRSNKRRNNPPDAEAASELLATPAYGKRRRVSTQHFEAGVNPITPPTSAARISSSRPRQAASQAREANQAVPLSPLLEAEEVVGHEDSDEGEDTELHYEEIEVAEDNAETAGEVGVITSSAEAAELVTTFSEDDHEVIATIRYRASFTDVEKSTIPDASFTVADYKLAELLMLDVWDDWVDDTLKNLLPMQVNFASLTAVVYPQKAKVVDRLPQRLRRGNYLDFEALKVLAASIDRNTSERLCVDFNLILAKQVESAPANQPASQPPPPPARSSQPRARTATIIQEEGLLGVVAAEHMAAGPALVIKDHWRCGDKDCRNYPYVCWLPLTGQPSRRDNHYPVNANIVAMWAKAITEHRCTIEEPDDRVKSAIMRARERSEVERVKRRQQGVRSDGGVLDEVRELQKSVLMSQLQQLNSGVAAQSSSQSSNWQPLEYEFWGEIYAHTLNFLRYFRTKWEPPGAEEFMDKIKKDIVDGGHIDINMLMEDSENGVSVALWVEHFGMQPGGLLQLRRHALKWRKSYGGLSEEDFDRIHDAVAQTRERRRSLREVSGQC